MLGVVSNLKLELVRELPKDDLGFSLASSELFELVAWFPKLNAGVPDAFDDPPNENFGGSSLFEPAVNLVNWKLLFPSVFPNEKGVFPEFPDITACGYMYC